MSEAMTQEQIDKMRVRNILRDYMKTPGATMETDVFVAMVDLNSPGDAVYTTVPR